LLARLPLAAGVALAEVLQGYVDDEVRLKWPNDLCVDGAKLGGILTEGVTRGRECSAIVGFGINHGSRPPQIEGRRTTSLTLETAQPPLLADLAVALATEVHRTIEQPSSAEELVDHVRRISAHRIGDPMQLATAHGTITGRFREIDEQGLLILKTDRGVRRVAAAEVVDR
jgi:BirA family biotin operon repressor/biotin-[acetyl-CoA-carboxylase] ligase